MVADCAIFLTHTWSPEIAAHFERLRRECASLVDVYLVANLPPDVSPETVPADLFIVREECEAVLPGRFSDSIGMPILSRTGHVDLIWISAFRHPRLAHYDRYWLIEFDVDFAGNWAEFFGEMREDDADLLTAHIRRWREGHPWAQWETLRRPDWSTAAPIGAFMPISRFSRRFLDAIVDNYSGPGWHGHFEVVLPTLAEATGHTISDIGGVGEFTPRSRAGKFYRDITEGPDPDRRSSHRFRPPHGSRYFAQDPAAFVSGMIYHPIKVTPPPAKPRKPKRVKVQRPRPTLRERLLRLIADPGRIPAAIIRRLRPRR